jgi:hypothetical protein
MIHHVSTAPPPGDTFHLGTTIVQHLSSQVAIPLCRGANSWLILSPTIYICYPTWPTKQPWTGRFCLHFTEEKVVIEGAPICILCLTKFPIFILWEFPWACLGEASPSPLMTMAAYESPGKPGTATACWQEQDLTNSNKITPTKGFGFKVLIINCASRSFSKAMIYQ